MFRAEEAKELLDPGAKSFQGQLMELHLAQVQVQRRDILYILVPKEQLASAGDPHYCQAQVGILGHDHKHQQVAKEHLEHMAGSSVPGGHNSAIAGRHPWTSLGAASCWF